MLVAWGNKNYDILSKLLKKHFFGGAFLSVKFPLRLSYPPEHSKSPRKGVLHEPHQRKTLIPHASHPFQIQSDPSNNK